MIIVTCLLLLLFPAMMETSIYKDMSIFSIMKTMPNLDPIEHKIQLNSIWSWSQLIPMKNLILFFDDDKSCNYIKKNLSEDIRCHQFSKDKCYNSRYNRPYMSCAFDLAQKEKQTSILIFVNGDIMLDKSVFQSISFINNQHREYFLVGCRRDFILSSSQTQLTSKEIFEKALHNNAIHSTTGIDLIAFKLNTRIQMPKFLVGVYRWDNWLLSEILLRTNVSVIDITQSTLIIHQQKEIEKGKEVIHHSLRSGALYNDELVKNLSKVDYKIGFIHNAQKILEGNCEKHQCHLNDNLNRNEIILLKQRANEQNYIAVLTVSTGYMSMAFNWICWAKRINFHNYIFLAEDLQSYEILRSSNQPVYISREQASNHSMKQEAKYGSYEFQLTMIYRLEFLMRVLRAGFHFLSADLDTIWFDNPFKYVSHNLSITIQGQTHKETKMSGGFILMHATHHGRKFWQDVITCQHDNLRQLREQEHLKKKLPVSQLTEQECINDRLKTVKIKLLDPYLFPDGRSFFDLHRSQHRGVIPVVIHGNWLVGLENKFNRLKSWNLLASTTNSCQSIHNGVPFHLTHKPNSHQIRIRILTFNRLESLQRLLKSLLKANYQGDTVPLHISVDHPSSQANSTEINQWKQLKDYLDSKHPSKFHWPYGPMYIHFHKEHVGLLGQWTKSTDHEDIQVFLEDDIVVSSYFYIFIKETIRYYYLNETNYDSRMYGIALQYQHTILGQKTGQKLSSIEIELNKTEPIHFFKYQLLGTWGTVFFPKHWQTFLKWFSTVKIDDVQSGCTPGGLLSTEWWVTRYNTGRMWTPWFIRFAFEQGWYSLYTNFPNREAFAVSYRESGLNFQETRGPMNNLVEHFQPKIHLNFTSNPPIYDYHFNRIDQPDLLTIRPYLWHPKHFLDQCHKIEKENKSRTSNLIKKKITTITNVKREIRKESVQIKYPEHEITYIQAKLINDNDDNLPSSSSNCFKWFLFFEAMFVIPIIIILSIWFCLLRRTKRTIRRKIYIN